MGSWPINYHKAAGEMKHPLIAAFFPPRMVYAALAVRALSAWLSRSITDR
jgi:hypothetical protein